MPSVKMIPAVDPVQEVQPVQGKMPDSVEEYRFSVSLDKLGIDYVFQYPVAGGSSRRGGTLIDFLVQTAPFPTPVFIDGAYWHERYSQSEDELLRAKIVNAFRGAVRKPESIAAGLLKTQAASDAKARMLFG